MWKRHWIPAALALILVVQAVTAAALWGRVNGLRAELADSRQAAADLETRLAAAETALQDLQAVQERPEPSARLENPVVSPRSRTLTVDITAQVPDVHAPSLDIGFCHVGEPYSLAWEVDALSPHADGITYTGTVTIPLDLDAGLELRLEDDTVLYTADSMRELLPLRLIRGGTSWHYSRAEQRLSQCDWSAVLADPSGHEAEAVNGAFRVYRNGEAVFTGRETEERYLLEADGEMVDSLGLACAPGDHMLLTYRCEDAFGLRYEFPIQELVALDWDDMRSCPLSHAPAVTWPE